MFYVTVEFYASQLRVRERNALAEVVNIAVALPEEHGHARRHIYTQKSVEIPYHRRHSGKSHRFRNGMICQILAAECRDLEIKLDNKGPIQTLDKRIKGNFQAPQLKRSANPEDSQDDKKDDLKEMPVTIIGHLEEYKFPCTKRIHGLMIVNE